MWKDLGNGWVGYGISMKDIFCNPIASQKGIHVFYPSFIVVRFCLRVRRRGVRAAHTPHWPLLNTSRGGIWTNYIPITASIALRVQVLHTITVKRVCVTRALRPIAALGSLSAQEGDRVEVLRKDLSGWSYGCLDGHGQREGWFPDWIIREKTNSWATRIERDGRMVDRFVRSSI